MHIHIKLRRVLRAPPPVLKWHAASDRVLPVSLSCRLLLDTARGLGHMHAKGKVHRDVKAGNVVVVGGDDEASPLTAKVADFGMACGEKNEDTVTPLELHPTPIRMYMCFGCRNSLVQTWRRSCIHRTYHGADHLSVHRIPVYRSCILHHEVLGKSRIIQIPPSTHARNILVIRTLPS